MNLVGVPQSKVLYTVFIVRKHTLMEKKTKNTKPVNNLFAVLSWKIFQEQGYRQKTGERERESGKT